MASFLPRVACFTLIDAVHTTVESVDDGVDDRRRRTNGAALTRTFDAEWARPLLPKLFFGLHSYGHSDRSISEARPMVS